ncbi:Ig-like domain-containing protein, partial [Aromatoleum diolicum]
TALSDTDSSSQVTFTFSEAPVGFTAGDIVAVGGTVTNLQATADSLVYTAIFTATDGFAGTASVSVANDLYTDAAGNLGSGGSDTVPVDRSNPTLTVNIVDTALSDTDTSSQVTFTFSEAPVGFTAGDIVAVGGTVTNLQATADPLVYTATFTTDGTFTGTASVSVANDLYTDATGNLGSGGSDTVQVTIPPVIYDGSDWQVQNGAIQPKGQGSITFTAGASIHFDFHVKDGDAVLALDAASKFFAKTGMTASIDKIFNDANETVYRVTLTNTTAQQISIGNSEQLGLVWSNVNNVANDVSLINSDEYVLLNNDGASIKVATSAFAGTTTVSGDQDYIWLSSSKTGQEFVKAPISTGEVGDTVAGSGGDDIIYGNPGANIAGLSNDNLAGGDGNDLIDGRSGNDILDGGAGNDHVLGGYGNDALLGGTGNDMLWGDAGNDTLSGGAGNDILHGGLGADTFKWTLADASSVDVPTDVIKDFDAAAFGSGGDRLDLKDLLEGTSATNESLGNYLDFSFDSGTNSTTIAVHSGGTGAPVDQVIVLENVNLAGSFADDAAIISDLLSKGKLITD